MLIKRDDLLGPKGLDTRSSKPLQQLQSLRGLTQVKKSVNNLIALISTNAGGLCREYSQSSLVRCFRRLEAMMLMHTALCTLLLLTVTPALAKSLHVGVPHSHAGLVGVCKLVYDLQTEYACCSHRWTCTCMLKSKCACNQRTPWPGAASFSCCDLSTISAELEEAELRLKDVCLNRVFMGNPGTGVMLRQGQHHAAGNRDQGSTQGSDLNSMCCSCDLAVLLAAC